MTPAAVGSRTPPASGGRTPLAMRRDPGRPLHPAAELLALDRAGGIAEITMPMATPGPGRTFLLTRAPEIRTVLGDPALFSNVLRLPGGGPGGDASPTGPGSLLGLDPPRHTALRRMLSAEFSPRRIAGLAQTVQATTRNTLAALRGEERAELVASFAQPIPAVVIAELLGVPAADREAFCRRSAVAIDTRLPALARAQNRAEMQAYMGELVARLRREPNDGLLSGLIAQHGAQVTDAELVSTGNLLLLAGHETTASLIGQSILLLLQEPARRAELLSDPEATSAGVEELLRFLTVFHFSLPRTATRDTVVAGQPIAAGDRILCSFPVANRDPGRDPSRDGFLPLREAAPHLAFGYGIHYCLGAPLARLELRTALPALFEAFPESALDAAEPPAYRDGSLTFGLDRLPVVLGRPAGAGSRT